MRVLAYLDAGSSSMILQALLGGVAGIAVALKMFGKRVFSIFTFWKKDEPVAAEATTATTASATTSVPAATPAKTEEAPAKETV